MVSWLVEGGKDRQTKKRDDAAVKIVDAETYLDHGGHGCRVEGGWINWRRGDTLGGGCWSRHGGCEQG